MGAIPASAKVPNIVAETGLCTLAPVKSQRQNLWVKQKKQLYCFSRQRRPQQANDTKLCPVLKGASKAPTGLAQKTGLLEVPVMVQQSRAQLVSMRMRVPSLALLSGLRIGEPCGFQSRGPMAAWPQSGSRLLYPWSLTFKAQAPGWATHFQC